MHISITYLKKILLFHIIFLIGLQLKAQDLFFNQYDMATLATNPGQSGVLQDSWVSLNYRSIPLSTGEKFNTTQVSGFYPLAIGQHRLVISGSFFSDRISEFFSTNGGTLGASLSISISDKSELSFGTQASFYNTGLQENFTTDNQFVNGIFDPSLPSGELINNIGTSNFSASSGLFWQTKGAYEQVKAFAGLSIFNFTKPDASLTNLEADQLPATYKATVGLEIYRQQNFAITPSALGISRNGAQWFQVGGKLSYDLVEDNFIDGESKQVGFGGWYSTNGAVVLSLQYVQSNIKAAVSFDLPTGNEIGTIRNNAFEIALHYRLVKKKRKVNTSTKFSSIATDVQEEVIEIAKPKSIEDNSMESLEPTTLSDDLEKIPVKEIVQKNEETIIKPARLTDEEKSILGKHVRYKIGSDLITDDSKKHLDKVIEIFKKHEKLEIQLIGHTCSLGNSELNKKLSLQRASKVKQYLFINGINRQRMTTIGKGENQPLVRNSNDTARQQNRRVEIKISDLEK